MTFNPHVTIQTPFPESELPALYRWMEKSWRYVACDQTPSTLKDWMEYQLRRMRSREILTWGVYLNGDLAGYLEMKPHVITVLDPNTKEVCLVPAIDYVADGHGIFKRDMYGHDKTQTAINLVLQEIFAGGIEIMQFALFSHNRLMIALHESLGGHFGGALGSPVTQNDEPVAMELWILTKYEWVQANKEWLRGYVQMRQMAGFYITGNDPITEASEFLLGVAI